METAVSGLAYASVGEGWSKDLFFVLQKLIVVAFDSSNNYAFSDVIA